MKKHPTAFGSIVVFNAYGFTSWVAWFWVMDEKWHGPIDFCAIIKIIMGSMGSPLGGGGIMFSTVWPSEILVSAISQEQVIECFTLI